MASSSTVVVERPIVRSFQARFKKEIAAHVRGGGHAIVWESKSRAKMIFPEPDEDNPQDLGEWSLLDMHRRKWSVESRGLFRGFAVTAVPRDCLDIVRRRAHRDAIHPGSTRKIELDCLECGACCKDNDVQLFRADLDRFRAAGRVDLTKPPLAKKRGNKTVLTLLRNKSCRHLASDNKCGIYEIRPDACSMFPVASECCLYARFDAFGAVDGLHPDEP